MSLTPIEADLKALILALKRFSSCIGASVVEEVEDAQVVCLDRPGHCFKGLDIAGFYIVIPKGESFESLFFACTYFEDIAQFRRQVVSLF